jgi:hypothetical protein
MVKKIGKETHPKASTPLDEAEIQADLPAVPGALLVGSPLDAQTAQRIRERAGGDHGGNPAGAWCPERGR